MYISEYTNLNDKERRQLRFKRKYKEDNPNWDDSMVLLKDLVDQNTKEGIEVLDLGCGHGNFVVDELSHKFSSKIGIDAIKEATDKNVSMDEVVIGNISDLPFADAQFDLVISLWVLEHVENSERVFNEVSRVLKPGGVFAFVTPNKKSLLIHLRRLMSDSVAKRLLKRFYGRVDDDVFDVYYRANSPRDLLSLLDSSGMKSISILENPDPSYTSFGSFTYQLSKGLSKLPGPFFKPHIMCVAKKEF